MARRVTADSLKQKTQDLGYFLIQDLEDLITLLKKTNNEKFNLSAAKKVRVQSIEISRKMKDWRRLSMDYLYARQREL